MRLEGTPQEFAELAQSLQHPHFQISDSVIAKMGTGSCGFNSPLSGEDKPGN